jgi:hypothetical protein
MVAHQNKLIALAITDHDTFEGYHSAKNLAQELQIELIPGVEITSIFNNRESHILAYYFDPDSDLMTNFLLTQRVARRNRIKGIIDTLTENGVDLDYEEVRAEANGANIGRPHVAQVLIHKGYVGNYFEAFSKYLSNEQLGEIKNTYPDFKEVIETIKSAGGASVLAHPGKLYSSPEIEHFIDAGIDGIECIHPSHNFTLQKKYTTLTEERSLLLTGGSDYHGGSERAHVHLGVVSVAEKYVEKMRRMTTNRKQLVDLK